MLILINLLSIGLLNHMGSLFIKCQKKKKKMTPFVGFNDIFCKYWTKWSREDV